MKITVKFLKGAGTWGIFKGSKNCGSNYPTDTKAATDAQKMFPGATVIIKQFYK